MKTLLTGAAKRLTFSLVLLAVLGGCAVYETTPATYSYYDSEGQLVYVTPRVVTPAPVYSYPRYVGPPVSLSFGFSSGHYHGYGGHRNSFHGGHWRGGHGGWYGGRGHGYGGMHGGWRGHRR